MLWWIEFGPSSSGRHGLRRVASIVSHTSAVLGITRFRRRALWSTIDATLRDAMPRFLAQPGIEDAWLGRRGPEVDDERVVASVWSSPEAERTAARLPEMLDDIGADIDPPSRIVLPLVLDLRFPRPDPPSILRIYEGETKPGELEAYVEDARRGSLRDGEREDGPIAVCMSVDPPDRFITASVWTGWASIEACTGGDIHRPLLTRNVARLAAGGPTHYEVVLIDR